MNHIEEEVTHIRQAAEVVCDSIDRIKVSTRHTSKGKAESTKARIRKVINDFIGIASTRKITPGGEETVIMLLNDVAKGKHENILFQRMEDGSIMERFTGIIIKTK
jgi:hypothetical protein